MARLFVHVTTLRCALLLLSAVTLVYLIIYLIWDERVSREHLRIQAGHAYSFKRLSEQGLQHADLVNIGNHHVPAGMGVWLKDRNIQVISAILDLHPTNQSDTRIVLPSFLQHSSQRDFVCCFHSSAASDEYIEVPASLDFIDLRFIVDIQNAAYICIVKNSESNHKLKFVSFAPQTCQEDVSLPLKVIYPVRRSWEFAVCTKVAYARLEPSHLVEWFEYMKLIGASKVVTFHNNLHPDSRRVFDFYAAVGFLELVEYKPQRQRNGTRVIYKEKNSQTHEAREEKTLVVRDCQYRLAGYDFVITIDFDELPVPARPHRTFNSIMQDLLRNHPDAAAFRMDPILLPPEWQNPTQGLYHWQFSSGTYIAPYCVKWAYIPSRTWLATTHEIVPQEGYKTYVIPQDVLHFLHFRSCKTDWQEVHCKNLTHTVKNEALLKRFRADVLRNMRKLPLESLITDKEYVRLVRAGAKPGTTAGSLDDDPLVELLLTDQ
ncbi:hypothetical protein BsWGS_26403 [Bradybaena similaris]